MTRYQKNQTTLFFTEKSDAQSNTMRVIIELIASPDASKKWLKKGNTCSVYANESWVVKQYNQKSFTHKIKQILGFGRAKKGYLNMQQLQQKNIRIPEPIAYGYQKRWGLKTTEFLITSRLKGETLAEYLLNNQKDTWQKQTYINNTVIALNGLWKAGWVHGDMKTNNIMIIDGHIFFIDFDALSPVSSQKITKDKNRFLKNFIDDPFYLSIKSQFDAQNSNQKMIE